MDYLRIHKPDHHRADGSGFVGEHIVLMEEILGRLLTKIEIVHHKDFHKPNNDRDNLKNMTRKQHQQIPAMQARFLVKKGLMNEFFDWWEIHKNNVKTLEQEIEIQLVKVRNQKIRMALKYERQQNVKTVS